ncbi:MAG: CDP-alcohol phosphatidyltransferase family protein [Actinomycetales bacterium]|nr:CDP-alcohol phosphatidyltransferase family protein [Actinomycetales bacterium]
MDEKPQMSLWRQWGTLPNVLSSIRLALVPVFLLLIVNGKYTLALIVLASAGITDYLDGYFARRLNQVTRLGQLLDPAADRLYIFSTLIGLTITGHIPLWLAAAIIARDVMLLAVYPVLATHGYGPLPVHYLGKAGTFALLYAFPLLLMAQVWQSAAVVILPVAWAFAWWGVGLYWWAGAVYVLQVRQIVKFGTSKNH